MPCSEGPWLQHREAIAPDSTPTIPIAVAHSPVPLCRETPDHHLWRSSHCFLWQGGCGDPCSLSLRCGVWGRAMARGHSWAGLTQQASLLGHQGPPAVRGHAAHWGTASHFLESTAFRVLMEGEQDPLLGLPQPPQALLMHPSSSKPVGPFSRQPLLNLYLCHVSVILTTLQTFKLSLYLLWWSVVRDLWHHCCNLLKDHVTASYFDQMQIFLLRINKQLVRKTRRIMV